MARRSKDLGDEEIVRFQRFNVAESAAATYTEQSYDTQLSIDRGFIWMIHWIEAALYAGQIDDPAQDAAESISIQILRESQAGILSLSDPDVMWMVTKQKDRMATIGTDAGPVVHLDSYPLIWSFPIPLPFAAQNIHIGVVSTCAAPQSVSGRVAYTLRRVSDKFFYRVAQALIS